MAPENILRDPEEHIAKMDLSRVDLSKVDTFAIGVTLVNMLTADYLFESCLMPWYEELMVASVDDGQLLKEVLFKKMPRMQE